ncbi:MAG TPA: alcohol dehydrogenase catalytic domain-containing protein [Thermodesulfovibrionales bacterium]|nr:alcohol dehydrogenase catalytic domain-containing protein [Thermodesulfovibrionales bacterium]
MNVARYYGEGDIRIEEMPVPLIGPGEMLIRIRASGICGSDVMHWYRAGRGPLVLGHEIAGEVASVGAGVGTYKVGDRVTASHHVPCNTCHYCLNGHHTVCDTLRSTNFHPGGFAEYVRLPSINVDRGVYLLHHNVSFAEATFVEPLACVYRGQRIAGTRVGKSVLVIGSGISGLLHIQTARVLGASMIGAVDIVRYRLDFAKKLGADVIFEAGDDLPESFRRMNRGRPADIVILTTGAEKAISSAFRSVDRGGTILFFAPASKGVAVPLPVNDLFWRNEITLTSSYAANYDEHTVALELIRQGKVNVGDMITHRLPLSETAKGFSLVEEAKESMKVIIEP